MGGREHQVFHAPIRRNRRQKSIRIRDPSSITSITALTIGPSTPSAPPSPSAPTPARLASLGSRSYLPPLPALPFPPSFFFPPFTASQPNPPSIQPYDCVAGPKPHSRPKSKSTKQQGHGDARDRRRHCRGHGGAVQAPVVITTDLRLNEPRDASLPNIMKAKKPVLKITPEEPGVDFKPQLEVLKVTKPPKRAGGGKVESVEELVGWLKEAAV